MIAEALKYGCAERTEAVGAEGAGRGVPRWVLGAWILAVNWEVVRWYVSRLKDGGDEPWGLAALIAAVVLMPRMGWRARMSNTALAGAGLLAMAAVFGAGILPLLARGGLVAGALGVVLGCGRERVIAGATGRTGLLVLSLPVVATAQFYAGYPLRVIAAELGRPLLWLAGVATERTGVVLSWSGGEVVVDAPCSGVRMLWAGVMLACGLAAWRRMRGGRTVMLVAMAVAGVVVANALRAAVLFLTESGVWPNAGGVHEAVGTAVFGGLAMALWVWAGRDGGREVATQGNTAVATTAEGRTWMDFGGWGRMGVVVGLGVVGWSLVRAEAGLGRENAVIPGEREAVVWPEVFEGKPLMPAGRPEQLGLFAGGFSGETRVFEQPGRVVVLRWLRAASRTVHPAADCFRARGYRVETGGLVRDDAGGRWSEFRAERAGEAWRVRERWRDERGSVWTDVSAWWWAAQGAEARGPWWAEMVAVRE